MRCPYCGANNDIVTDTREREDGRVIRRRRYCRECGRKFTTKEMLVNLPVMVRKRDGRREVFDREKLRKGIEIACNKRPITPEQIDEIVGKIEGKIQDMKVREVESRIIGELVMDILKEVDDVAYVRFASVYRKFQDKEEFLRELSRLKEE
jgi:transcriptional repressor NrdR